MKGVKIMTKYIVEYWEEETVWVRQRISVDSEIEPNKNNMKEIIETNPTVDYLQSDYSWETEENNDYDFDTDFMVERED